MMGNLEDLPLEQLLQKAEEIGVLDRWESVDGVLVFELSTMQIAIEKPNAQLFVRGLLRGFERALILQEGSTRAGSRQ